MRPGKVNNVTPYILNDIFVNGIEPLNFFDGVAADAPVNVYLTGRTNDSGTRITAQADIGFRPSCNRSSSNGVPSAGRLERLRRRAPGRALGTTDIPRAETSRRPSALPMPAMQSDMLHGLTRRASRTARSRLTIKASRRLPVRLRGSRGARRGIFPGWKTAPTRSGATTLCRAPKVSSTSFINANFGPDLINALEYEIANPAPGAIPTADLIKNLNVHRNADGGDVLAGN